MSNAKTPLRPGMTALAAVIALSSTSLLAQSVDSTAATPPVEAAPAISLAPPAVTPETTAPAASAAAPVTEAPALVNENNTGTAVTTAPAVAAPGAKSIPQTARRVEPRATSTTAAPVAATVAVATRAAPAPAAVVPPMEAAPAAKAPVEPVQSTAETATITTSDDNGTDLLPIAGIAGAGVLAAAGTAYALGRRKRRRAEEQDYVVEDVEPAVVMTPVPTPASYGLAQTGPAWTAEPAIAKRAPIRSQSDAKLPEGFDLSIYGPHVQQAYRGPTAENPSLSLSKRLKRARFFDQRDRRLKPATARRVESAPAFSNWQTTRTLEPAL